MRATATAAKNKTREDAGLVYRVMATALAASQKDGVFMSFLRMLICPDAGECFKRLCVYRSNANIYAQIIDDTKGVTLVQASTMDASVKGTFEEANKTAAAKAIGKLIGERAVAAGVEKVVFDRSGYLYTGRVASLAEGAREAGLKF